MVDGTYRAVVSRCLSTIALLSVVFVGAIAANKATAHELQPAIADLGFSDAGKRYEIAIALNLEAIIADIGPDHDNTQTAPTAEFYEELRQYSSEVLRSRFETEIADFLNQITIMVDERTLGPELVSLDIPEVGDVDLVRSTTIVIGGDIDPPGETIRFGWNAKLGDIVLRGPLDADGNGYSGYLQSGDVSPPIPIEGGDPQTFWEVLLGYIVVGFDHIVPKGLDHILFVVGLFLLSARLRPLFWQVTAFTIAHSITLALGILGIISVPASIVEPLIAASIIYICVENLLFDDLSRMRPLIIFLFGLLHGLGFASVLTDFGLSQGQFAAGLIGFNLGVEFGQIAILIGCFFSVGFWFGDRDWYRKAIVVPGSLAIAAIGSYWLIERTLLA